MTSSKSWSILAFSLRNATHFKKWLFERMFVIYILTIHWQLIDRFCMTLLISLPLPLEKGQRFKVLLRALSHGRRIRVKIDYNRRGCWLLLLQFQKQSLSWEIFVQTIHNKRASISCNTYNRRATDKQEGLLLLPHPPRHLLSGFCHGSSTL